jgi:hypothetical protein
VSVNPKLLLSELSRGLPGITPSFGSTLAEAGAICFEEQNHKNGVELQVEGTSNAKYNVYWEQITDQMLRCWGDAEYTTEQGAYGVAILLIRDLTDYTVLERSWKGTGFDFWLGKERDYSEFPFQDKARLEVSGIRSGYDRQITARMLKKLAQVIPSDSTLLPAYIVIVEFSTPISRVMKK